MCKNIEPQNLSLNSSDFFRMVSTATGLETKMKSVSLESWDREVEKEEYKRSSRQQDEDILDAVKDLFSRKEKELQERDEKIKALTKEVEFLQNKIYEDTQKKDVQKMKMESEARKKESSKKQPMGRKFVKRHEKENCLICTRMFEVYGRYPHSKEHIFFSWTVGNPHGKFPIVELCPFLKNSRIGKKKLVLEKLGICSKCGHKRLGTGPEGHTESDCDFTARMPREKCQEEDCSRRAIFCDLHTDSNKDFLLERQQNYEEHKIAYVF